MTQPTEEGGLDRAREALIRALGRQSVFWGLGKTVGEIFAVLYLSAEPVALEEVARRLQVTKGSVSIAIRQLEHLGMVRRSWQTGDRRVYFAAETDLWRITHSVLGLRHRPEFDQSFALVEESIRLAGAAGPSPERDVMLARLAALQEFYRLLDSLVEIALSLPPGQLKVMVQGLKAVVTRLRRQP